MAGGSINVFTDALATASQELQQAAHEGTALRGNFSRAVSAAGACDPACVGAFQEMQDALAGALAGLQQEIAEFGPQTGEAAVGYAATEGTVARSFAEGAS